MTLGLNKIGLNITEKIQWESKFILVIYKKTYQKLSHQYILCKANTNIGHFILWEMCGSYINPSWNGCIIAGETRCSLSAKGAVKILASIFVNEISLHWEYHIIFTCLRKNCNLNHWNEGKHMIWKRCITCFQESRQ